MRRNDGGLLNRRTLVRAAAIGLQWLFLAIALGSLVMRSDTSFSDVVTPHLGAAPMFVGAVIAGALLGLTIESPKVLAPLVVVLCVVSAGAIGVMAYAPVVDGVQVRTTFLDNFVSQRVLIVSIILSIGAVPGSVGGNLLGAYLDFRQEIMPDPNELATSQEVPWWERRREQSGEQQSR